MCGFKGKPKGQLGKLGRSFSWGLGEVALQAEEDDVVAPHLGFVKDELVARLCFLRLLVAVFLAGFTGRPEKQNLGFHLERSKIQAKTQQQPTYKSNHLMTQVQTIYSNDN